MFRRVTGNRISEENSSARFECNGGKKGEKERNSEREGLLKLKRRAVVTRTLPAFAAIVHRPGSHVPRNKGLIFIVVSFTGELDQRLRFNNARETD